MMRGAMNLEAHDGDEHSTFTASAAELLPWQRTMAT